MAVPVLTSLDIKPGALVFCHSVGFVGRAIRIAQWINGKLRPSRWKAKGCPYNHVAMIDRPSADGKDWLVIQAEAHGVTNDKFLSSIAPGGHYEIIPLPAGIDAMRALQFARSQVSSRYGVLTIVNIIFNI